jgi:hypothetical protein
MFRKQHLIAGRTRSFSFLIVNALCSLLLVGLAANAFAQITPSKESLSDVYPGKAYSPYAQRSFPDRVFWGDTHLHTGLSVDAGLFGARLGLDEAYRFARGTWRQVSPVSSSMSRASVGTMVCRLEETPRQRLLWI